MSEKAVDSDFESLDALERTFQKVLMEVMADKSLDAFRTEYERIHDALVQCHTYNGHLVNHVKALNEEIIANSLKVNSVLKLSRDDQKTISGLRFEFDKAWRMVELAEERENKSKDIIEELKAEHIYVRHWDSERISQYLRITVGTEEEMKVLFDFLRRK